jgi:predicted membrane metal-binding protein
MTSSSKLTWGIIFLITGWVLFLVGILISFTVVGACLGIPMALVGLPLWIWGAVWAWQGKVKRAEEAIATGVRQGIQQAAVTQAAARTPSSAPPPAPPVVPPQGSK